MKVVAVIQADLETTAIGTRSRLGEELRGRTVLQRTVERMLLAKQVDSVAVLCPAAQAERCRNLVEHTDAVVHPVEAPSPPWRALVTASRKWSLDGWRGGVGGTTSFDEYVDCRVLAGVLEVLTADAILSVPAAAPVFAPELADGMIARRRALEEQTRLVFTQAPPGLAGMLLDADLVREVGEQNIPVGWIFSYKPDNPLKDLTFQPACFEIPAEARHASGRLIADSRRSMETLEALLEDHPDPDVVTTGRWLQTREYESVERMPREVEIELTTDDPFPEAQLRPRGAAVGARGPIELAVIEKITSELCAYDDSLVVLGGFGEPLRHPRIGDVLEILRPALNGGDSERSGVFGLCVRTAGIDLDENSARSIVEHRVDVLNVILDAWTPELYARLHAPMELQTADLDRATGRLDRLSEARQAARSVHPIVVPEMTKARENLHELDEFHDGWLRRVGAVCISGYSHRAGQCTDRSVMSMAPAGRTTCRRLRSRCIVLADGRVAVCDQDFRGLHTVGDLKKHSLDEIWGGENLAQLREAHRAGRYEAMPLCTACDEWHRL